MNGKLCFAVGGKSGLALRQLRSQGLVSCGSPTEKEPGQSLKATCVTHSFRIPTDGLRLNCDASHGVLEAELLDMHDRRIPGFTADQARFEGVDATGIALKWGNRDLSQLNNRVVRLRLFLQRARVYALTQDTL